MKKIMLLVFMVLLFVPLINAMDWDNALDYENNDLTVKIKNWFGLIGWLGIDDEVGEVELKSHPSVDYVREVPIGKSVTMFYDFKNFKEIYENGLGNVEFTDEITGKVVERDWIYVYWGEKEIPDYEPMNCKIDKKGDEICEWLESGTRIIETWLPYDSGDIPKGNIRIGIEVDSKFGDMIDGVWTIAGRKIKKHSTWQASLETNLISWYKLDETVSSTATDSHGSNDGDYEGSLPTAVSGVSAVTNNAQDMDGVGDDVNTTVVMLVEDTEYTINLWVYPKSEVTYFNALSQHGAGTSRIAQIQMDKDVTKWQLLSESDASAIFTNTNTYHLDNWQMITLVRNATSIVAYFNGTLEGVTLWNGNDNTIAGTPMYIGVRDGSFDRDFNGTIDEVGVWDRALTQAEITILFNSGDACTYQSCTANPPPVITLNAPANLSTVTNPTVVFNATANDNLGLANMSLIVNGSYVSTNSSVFNATLTQFPYTLVSAGFWNWTVEVCDLNDSCVNGTLRGLTSLNDLAITLNAPANAFNSTSNTIIFNGTGSDDTSLVNISMIVNGSYNGTNSSVFNNTLTQFPRILADGFYNWTMGVCDDLGVCLNATSRNVSIDGTNPLLNLTNPMNNVSYSNGTTGVVTWTATDDNIDACFFEYAGINETVTCSTNSSIFNLTASRTMIFWVNDTFGNLVSNLSVWDYLVVEHNQTFNATTFETASETFYINITAATTPSSAKLIYNGTTYTSATITNVVGNTYNISRTIDIPTTVESKPFFWNITVWGSEVETGIITNQTVSLTNFTLCAAETPYINISFTNETLGAELVTGQINSDWYYWLGGRSVVKTLSYINTTEHFNYSFCLADVNRTLNTNVSLIYDNSISEQRSFSSDFTLTNTTTQQTLFLLPTGDGVFITFQLVTVAEQVISGVVINVTKSGTIVETGTTDAAGLKTFFLDPDTTYGFSFFKSGFDIFTTSIAPTQTTFTVTLGQAAADVINDTTKGISYFINPTANVLDNNTIVEFNLTFVSSFWALDNFELFLKNSTGDFFNATASTTATGGFLSQSLDTGNNTDIIMEITWTINGNQTNVTRTWIVRNFEDEGFSIKTFFDDLSTYLTSNMFGLTDFGLGIILFLIIVVTTGILSVKFGISSPAGIAIIVFSMVAFFDVALGIMPNPVNAIPNFPTVFMAIIFLGTFIKEAIIR